jgi:hypothetical protein
MQVWNTFDPNIIFHIIGKDKANEGSAKNDVTIDELVRKTAINS